MVALPLISTKNFFNKCIYDIYQKNYTDDNLLAKKTYELILESDYWIDLVDEDLNIMASCSISLDKDILNLIFKECGFLTWFWELIRGRYYDYISIWDVYVPIQFRNKGYGTQLLNFCIHFIKQTWGETHRGVYLLVGNTNIQALKIYKKFFSKYLSTKFNSSIYLKSFLITINK